MLKIRLQKVGKKNSPSFRVVLVEHTFRPQGKFLELLGSYNKIQKQKSLNKERILHWISKGAQCSDTMHNMLVDEKIIDKPKVKAWKPKKKPAGETEKPVKKIDASIDASTEKVEETTKVPKEELKVAPTLEEVGVDTETKTS
ncbi:MAG: 30S ribosomal protein S16 [Patescibacteria group bacterium]